MFICHLVILSRSLSDGNWVNYEAKLRYSERDSFNISLTDLIIGKRYEVRASWPSTSPAKLEFTAQNVIDISDEKFVFIPQKIEDNIQVVIEAIGKSKQLEKSYIIPLNISLDRQYFYLTWCVWKLIFYLLPILLFSIIIVILYFPYG